MNIDDVDEESIIIEGDRLEAIFEKQKELMIKYHHIEKGNDLLQTDQVPVDLHDRMGQARLKDFAWRVTEELAESLEAYIDHPELELHYKEELADALHFLVELAVLSGVTPGDIVHDPDRIVGVNGDKLTHLYEKAEEVDLSFEAAMATVVLRLGQAMNLLKNKPWKNTHMLTDVSRYRNYIVGAFVAFAELTRLIGMGPDDMCTFYFRKSVVNKFRQRSNY